MKFYIEKIFYISILTIICLVVTNNNLLAQDDYYFNDYVVELSPKEKEALRLAGEWSERPVQPIHLGSGKVVYVLGATMPTIIGAPMQICDIELEAGEQVNEIVLGDMARWQLETGVSGSANWAVTHLFLKPLDAGLQTSLAVTTDRRVYHIKLVSQKTGHTPYVGFLYQEQGAALKKQAQKTKTFQTARTNSGEMLDMSGLNFNYNVKGKANFKPIQIYDNGQKMFIKMPNSTKHSEIPTLLVKENKKETTIVNYRFKNNTFEVDGVFNNLILVSGVGKSQKKIEIRAVRTASVPRN